MPLVRSVHGQRDFEDEAVNLKKLKCYFLGHIFHTTEVYEAGKRVKVILLCRKCGYKQEF